MSEVQTLIYVDNNHTFITSAVICLLYCSTPKPMHHKFTIGFTIHHSWLEFFVTQNSSTIPSLQPPHLYKVRKNILNLPSFYMIDTTQALKIVLFTYPILQAFKSVLPLSAESATELSS